jgi:tRNA/tmRNA/rRNA uracil-C5-methylase (TrmA/RlmC/RlmD family)
MTCVRIDDVAAGGAGVGRLPDGMAIFVPRTAPGDLAEVAITQRKQRYAYGRLVGLQERTAAAAVSSNISLHRPNVSSRSNSSERPSVGSVGSPWEIPR